MSQRFYADTNVMHLLRSTWSPEGFDEHARSANCYLGLGLHVIYELARGFLYPEHILNAKSAFQFLSGAECFEVLPPIDAVIRAEFHSANTGLPLITVLEPHNQLLARQEIMRLARGYADNACRFISARESDISVRHPEIALANMALARDFVSKNPNRRAQMQTFSGFRRQVLPTGRQALRNLATRHGIAVHESRLDPILDDPERFPVLNTWLNTQWYLVYVSVMYQAVPSFDKLDDFRHLMESAYCEIFVTNDSNLLARSQDIQPFKSTLSWEDFKSYLETRQLPVA